jgi:hypothetical protein
VLWVKVGAADTDWSPTLGGSGGGGGAGVTDLTATAPLSVDTPTGSVTVSHDASGVSAGSYGDATHVPAITVDATGHLTAVTSTAITFPASDGGPTATHGWQPWTTVVGGEPDFVWDEDNNLMMIYGPL